MSKRISSADELPTVRPPVCACPGHSESLGAIPVAPCAVNDSCVRCGQCGMLTCWSLTSEFRCGACGNGGPVSGAITDLNASDLG